MASKDDSTQISNVTIAPDRCGSNVTGINGRPAATANGNGSTDDAYHGVGENKNNNQQDEEGPKPSRKQFLRQRNLQTDYVAKRLNALKAASMKIPNSVRGGCESSVSTDLLWLGVYNWERALVLFCKRLTQEDVPVIKGALSDKMVSKFVGFVATHCHDIASRALTLAILEATLQEENQEQQINGSFDSDPEQSKSSHEASSKRTNPDNLGDEQYNSNKRQKTAVGSGRETTGKLDTAPKEENLSLSCRGHSHRGRIRVFLISGGLRLLHQWLIDATTTIRTSLPTNSGSFTGNAKQEVGQKSELPSPTSAILPVLLNLLGNISFDRLLLNIVKQSKIDRHISKLRNHVKQALGKSADETMGKTHPMWGGLNTADVKRALDTIKVKWKRAYDALGRVEMNEETANGNGDPLDGKSLSDPFLAFKANLCDRLRILESNTLESSPDWLKKLQANAVKSGAKRRRKGLSTADLEKLEREKERAAMLKKDLEKAQAYRRQCQAKLRELERKQKEKKQVTGGNLTSGAKVRWKDGMSMKTPSSSRNREILEQVFYIEGRDSKRVNMVGESLSDEFDCSNF